MPNKNIKINKKDSEIVNEVTVSGKEWNNLVDNQKKQAIKKLKIKGFRPGKVPLNIAEKHINMSSVFAEAISEYAKNHQKEIFEEVSKENKSAVNIPTLKLISVTQDEGKFEIIFPLMPDFSKIKYDKVKIKAELKKLTDKDVEKRIHDILSENALLIPLKKDEKTKNGDVVILNYKGFVNGEAFDGGEAENFELKLGSKTFIDTFEDQLVGKKIGYKGEVKVKFPDKYGVDKLKGQNADFQVEIVDAKRPEEIKLTKDNLGLLKINGADTVEKAKKFVKYILELENATQSINKFIEDFVNEVRKNNEISVHWLFLREAVDKRKKEFLEDLKKNGIKLREYLQLIGKTEEELEKLLFEEETEKAIFSSIVFEYLKDAKEKIKVEEEELLSTLRERTLFSPFEFSMLKDFVLKDENLRNNFESMVKDHKLRMKLISDFDKKGYEEIEKIFDKVHKELKKEIKDEKLKADKKEEKKEKKAPVKKEKNASKKSTTAKTKKPAANKK